MPLACLPLDPVTLFGSQSELIHTPSVARPKAQTPNSQVCLLRVQYNATFFMSFLVDFIFFVDACSPLRAHQHVGSVVFKEPKGFAHMPDRTTRGEVALKPFLVEGIGCRVCLISKAR